MSRKVCTFVVGNMDHTAHYDSPIGDITLASDGRALTGLWFDGQRYFGSTMETENGELSGVPSARPTTEDKATQEKTPPVIISSIHWLDVFFSGREPDFTPPLSLKGTTFQQRVWKELLTIPYGQTVTYGVLARRLGCRSAQAVGSAVGRNPISIIVPCHRVIGSNGALTGYAGGLDRKRTLLELEQKIYFAN